MQLLSFLFEVKIQNIKLDGKKSPLDLFEEIDQEGEESRIFLFCIEEKIPNSTAYALYDVCFLTSF